LSGSAKVQQLLKNNNDITGKTQPSSTTVNAGGYSQFTDNSNPLYISALNALYQYYPYLNSFQIYQVQSQIVNGQNFKFYINDTSSGDLYGAVVYVNLQGQAIV
jgi:hypothetical protein